MPYCPNCGVELAADAERCPLCLAPAWRPGASHARGPEETRRREAPVELAISALDPEDAEKLSPAEGRTLLWELLTVSLGIAALALLAIDLIDSPGIGWSRYPLASIGLAWALIGLLGAGRRARSPGARRLRLALAALAAPAYLLLLDLFSGSLDWSLAIGVPVSLATELIAGLAALAIARSRRRGANVAAILLAAVALICLAIESILDLAATRAIGLGWSSIVLVALLPVSLFLFYLHYRILGKKSLRRFFRL